MTDALIDTERLRANVEQITAQLRANPAGGLIKPRVSTRLIRDVSAEATWTQFGREFSLRNDEASGRAGGGDAPTAIRYFLSGIAFCLQVWYAKGAALVGCEVEDIRLDLEATFDMRVEYRLSRDEAVHERLLVEAWVISPSPRRTVIALAEEAHARCPLSTLVGRAIPIHRRLHHNGELVFEEPQVV